MTKSRNEELVETLGQIAGMKPSDTTFAVLRPEDARDTLNLIATLTAELAESQRLHDLGGSREANLLADVATLTAENERSIAAARLTQQNIAILTAENERLREVIEHLPVI